MPAPDGAVLDAFCERLTVSYFGELKSFVLNAEDPVFAVVDGAQFDDLPHNLYDSHFVSQSLYLDRGNGTADQLRTAPQFIWLDRDWHSPQKENLDLPRDTSDTVLDRLLALVGQKPAVVFWTCKLGGSVLYRHLRGINKVRLPEAEATTDVGDDIQGRLHVFRHADCNVLSQVLPVLTREQLARLLGPATSIMFRAEDVWGGGVKRIVRTTSGRDLPRGFLALSKEQMNEIRERRYHDLETEFSDILERRYPGKAFMDFNERMAGLRFHRREAVYHHGLTNDQHLLDYLEIILKNGAHVTQDAFFKSVMAKRSFSAEDKCRLLRAQYIEKQERA